MPGGNLITEPDNLLKLNPKACSLFASGLRIAKSSVVAFSFERDSQNEFHC